MSRVWIVPLSVKLLTWNISGDTDTFPENDASRFIVNKGSKRENSRKNINEEKHLGMRDKDVGISEKAKFLSEL